MEISVKHLCILHPVLLLMTFTNCCDVRYFAVGSADSLVSLWNVKELLCIRTFTKLEYVLL
jgi:hypothetical protein